MHVPKFLDCLTKLNLMFQIVTMEGAYLDDGNVQGRFFWKHELEGYPDAVIQISDDSFRFDAGFDEVLVNLDGELRRRGMRPFVLVYFWASFVEVVDEVMLAMSTLCPEASTSTISTYPDLSILLDIHYKPVVVSSPVLATYLPNRLTFNDIRPMNFPRLKMSTKHYDSFGLRRQTRDFLANRPQVILHDYVIGSLIEQQVDACVANKICG